MEMGSRDVQHIPIVVEAHPFGSKGVGHTHNTGSWCIGEGACLERPEKTQHGEFSACSFRVQLCDSQLPPPVTPEKATIMEMGCL